MKKCILIDGHHFIFRAYYAFFQMLREEDAKNAIFGFASMLLTLIENQKPDYLAFAFDKGKSFRHDEKPDYKGTRAKTPESLVVQMPRIYEMVETMGIKQFFEEGYEADDMLATIAKLLKKEHENLEVVVVSGDRDLLQIVEERIYVGVPDKKGIKLYDSLKVKEIYGVHPHQVPDYKGIAGDTADNIKGVPGLGPKTAIDLLEKFGSLENIYRNLNELSPKLKNKLEQHKSDAEESKYFATLVSSIPIRFCSKDISYSGIHTNILPFFQSLKFPSLEKRVQSFLQGQEILINSAEEVFCIDNKKYEDSQMSLGI